MEFNRETVLTAIYQAVEEKGYTYVGPCGMLTQPDGSHCLVGEVFARTTAPLPQYGEPGDQSYGKAVIDRMKAQGIKVAASVEGMFDRIGKMQDAGHCWGYIYSSVRY